MQRVDGPSDAETYLLAVSAGAAAVLTLAFDQLSVGTVLLLTLALTPWALLAGGVRMPTWLFAVSVLTPTALTIGLSEAGGPVFLGILVVARVFSVTSSWLTRGMTALAAASLPVLQFVVEDDGESLFEHGTHYFVAGVGVGALSGYLLYRQRELTTQLRWSRAQLDAAAAAEERRRIAREVHDVVAHSLTVVMLNVSGARKALATQPGRAAEALDRAETVGRESLDGIRRVVGLLRDADEPGQETEPPQPTALDLPTLVEQQRQAGAEVELEVDGDLAGLDRLTGAAVMRLAQEALTNAQRHAPGAPIRLSVDAASRDRVAVTVRNGPAGRAALEEPGRRRGLGLLGMRERVEGLGGSFSAGPDGDGWAVAAVLPLRDPALSTSADSPPKREAATS